MSNQLYQSQIYKSSEKALQSFLVCILTNITGDDCSDLTLYALKEKYKHVTLIANSIGAYFSVASGIDKYLDRAYFISPVADMERLILDMLSSAGATEDELKEKGVIHTGFGEDLSWKYLSYVREHPAVWNVPTDILYGSRDVLIRRESVEGFARRTGARLTVFEGGEHWFHTPEQMSFLDGWIRNDSY